MDEILRECNVHLEGHTREELVSFARKLYNELVNNGLINHLVDTAIKALRAKNGYHRTSTPVNLLSLYREEFRLHLQGNHYAALSQAAENCSIFQLFHDLVVRERESKGCQGQTPPVPRKVVIALGLLWRLLDYALQEVIQRHFSQAIAGPLASTTAWPRDKLLVLLGLTPVSVKPVLRNPCNARGRGAELEKLEIVFTLRSVEGTVLLECVYTAEEKRAFIECRRLGRAEARSRGHVEGQTGTRIDTGA